MSEAFEKISYLYIYPINSQSTDELITLSVRDFQGRLGYSDNCDVNIFRTEKGKPCLSEPENLYVSVSHSGEYCVIAVADVRIGVDIQHHDRFVDETEAEAAARYLKLSQRFFHSDEYEYVKVNPLTHFFDVFCLKESYVKCNGEGLDDNLGTYSVLPADRDLKKRFWTALGMYFRTFEFEFGYTFCMCSALPTAVEIVKKM